MKRWCQIVFVWMLLMSSAHAQTAAPALRCILEAKPPKLTVTLINESKQTVWLLNWGTPFEPMWTAPWLGLTRDGQEVQYQGAMVKRAAPQATQYFRMRAGQRKTVTVDMSQAYAMQATGSYQAKPVLHFHDYHVRTRPPSTANKPREMQALDVSCPAMAFVR